MLASNQPLKLPKKYLETAKQIRVRFSKDSKLKQQIGKLLGNPNARAQSLEEQLQAKGRYLLFIGILHVFSLKDGISAKSELPHTKTDTNGRTAKKLLIHIASNQADRAVNTEGWIRERHFLTATVYNMSLWSTNLLREGCAFFTYSLTEAIPLQIFTVGSKRKKKMFTL